MKLKQVLAVMLSSVMVLSAAPTEVFAFDDPGFLTDSSGGTADEGSEQLENGNASVASSEADGIFDEGTAQEENADVAADGSAVQGDISDAASDGNAEQNDIADEISQDEELQQDTQGSDSLEKEETDAVAVDMFSDGESADPADTQVAKSVKASGAVADNITWTLYEDGELAISGTGDMPSYYGASVPWNNYKGQITSLTVEAGITGIGDYTFSGCGALESAMIADSVITIGTHVFEECTSLENVTPELLLSE